MGEGDELHEVELPEYQISRVPITNLQYSLYVNDSGINAPKHWRDGSIPSGLENHPVVNVSKLDALKYCKWLSEKSQKTITLPSEAEWEKAARGDKDKRIYPWGENWRELHCNSRELGLGETIPVGLFINGMSPYGILDISGNVWEWMHTSYDKTMDGLNSEKSFVLRGASFYSQADNVRCAMRYWVSPGFRQEHCGFRVVNSSRSEE